MIYRQLLVFIESKEKKIQLDIYLRREVALQIFKYSDVVKWDLEVPLTTTGGYVLHVLFNNNKHNNDANYERFTRNMNYSKFKSIPLDGGQAYFTQINDDIPTQEFADLISDLIIDTYHPNNSDLIEYHINAY